MKQLFYVYPEPIPQKNAREISVLNTFDELCKILDATFVTQKFNLDEINEKFNLSIDKKNVLFLSKKFLFFKSTKFFNLRLLKIVKDNKNKDAVFYTRHLKIADFLLKYKKSTQKLIYEVHECFSLQNKNLFNIEKRILFNSDRVCIHNISTKNELEKFFNLKFSNATIVYNGVKIGSDFIKKEFEFDKIVYFGTFLLWKGVDLLIEFLKQNKNLKLYLYGNDKSPNANELKELLRQDLSIKERVVFCGFLAQNDVINELKKNSSILIIPSKYSTYSNYSIPLKLFEYMATSNVVLAPSFPPLCEIIKDGENGFLYKPQDISDLAIKFKEISNLDNQKLNEISKEGFKTIKELDWQNRAKNILECIGNDF
ncbi:glycosyltransferase family 4 protein [Campylobacter mucosalis]|uniref:glycosyltransferase family 4 protein n=1 Tax=Campylobacter mucosalis TaxID=202 RepID=UPI0014704FEA|nr:glycosyltransferase family 4 protein [Campylobacter mucosalis]